MAVTAGRGVATGRADGDVTSGRTNNDVSQREDLANFISMITRDETPFMSSIGKTKATAIFHEWQTDELTAPGDSRLVEGTDYVVPIDGVAAVAAADQTGLVPIQDNDPLGTSTGAQFNISGPNRTRLGNYSQINGKSLGVSGTRRAIDQAGVADEYAYQLKKRGTELRRDVEADLIGRNVADGSGRRQFGGYQAWINADGSTGSPGETVVFAGTVADTATADAAGRAGTAADGSSQGTGRASPQPATTATNRGSLSLSDIDQVMQRIYQEGGKASKIMLSPKLRRDFSDLMVTDSGVRRNIDMDGKLRQSVDIYMSDFGDLMVVPNYIMGLNTGTATTGVIADSAAFIYDPMWFNIATLRPLQEVDIGQRGDSTVGMLVEECTLEVRNPIGCGAIYNLR